jgi:anti-anti-sigma factor
VVLDFRKTDYYGSTALGFFVKLWKRVRDRDGRMAFCGVSDHEREILRVTHLDGMWPICSSREEAVQAVER